LSGIHKIQHVVVIMQENRGFDHYFGTYPGAEGLPIKNGKGVRETASQLGDITQPSTSTSRPARQ
jgi:phospholipase C